MKKNKQDRDMLIGEIILFALLAAEIIITAYKTWG
jgi:hypothetical protein